MLIICSESFYSIFKRESGDFDTPAVFFLNLMRGAGKIPLFLFYCLWGGERGRQFYFYISLNF